MPVSKAQKKATDRRIKAKKKHRANVKYYKSKLYMYDYFASSLYVKSRDQTRREKAAKIR